MPLPRSPLQRAVVLYEGRVQGVGFRFSVMDLARRFPVTGFVRNLPDGGVELVAEGEAASLDALLREISASRLGRHIVAGHESRASASGEFSDFRIRY